jgi:hypothetical protein
MKKSEPIAPANKAMRAVFLKPVLFLFCFSAKIYIFGFNFLSRVAANSQLHAVFVQEVTSFRLVAAKNWRRKIVSCEHETWRKPSVRHRPANFHISDTCRGRRKTPEGRKANPISFCIRFAIFHFEKGIVFFLQLQQFFHMFLSP